MFVVFNIIYWTYYMTVSKYNWDHLDLIKFTFKEMSDLYDNETIEG